MSAPIWNHCVARVTRTSPLPQAVLIGLVLVALVAGAQATHAVDSKRRTYSIPSGPLSQALIGFARDAGVLLSADARLTEGKQSPGLQGEYTLAEGLTRLLAGSGLAPVENADGSYTLLAPDPLAELVARAGIRPNYAQVYEPTPKKPKAPPPQKDDQGPTVLPEMTVTGQPMGEGGYTVPNATTATKTDTPIMETPVSIQVVPRAIIDDQQATRVEDVVKNVSGVQSSFNYGDEGTDFFIRGFHTIYTVFRNGFRTGGAGSIGIANLERIEVLKGPAAVLYGRVEPGGLINLVTKKPLFSPYYSIQQQFGSYDFYRTTLDATGPVLSNDSLAYRFNLEYLDKNSFRDFVSTERIFVAPSLTWRPREDTEVNLLVEYARTDGPEDEGIPAIGNRPAPLPISRSLEGPNTDQTTDDIRVYLTAFHQLTDDWKLRGGFFGYWSDYTLNYLSHGRLHDDNRTIDLHPSPVDSNDQRYGLYLETTGHFDAFGTEHEVLFGADYYLTDGKFDGWFKDEPEFVVSQDIFNPRVFNVDYAPVRATTPFFVGFGNEWVGVYFQDQITLFDTLHVLGGGRYDWAEARSQLSSVSRADAEAKEDTRTDRKFSPRVGLLYQPWPWLSLYGNYVESLGSSNGRSSTGGAPLKPQLGTQYEVGAKTEFFDGRLNATLAFYHLTKENLPAADLTTLDPGDSRTIGEARSRGIELDVSGSLTERLSLLGSYSYIDGKITKDPQQDQAGNPLPGNEGHQLPGAPRHSGSLWAKYTVIPERFDVGAGIFAASQRQGDPANSLQLPGYVRVDAYAAYHWKLGPTRMTAQVNINNVLDKEYFLSTNILDGNPREAILPGEPLTVLGSIRVEY